LCSKDLVVSMLIQNSDPLGVLAAAVTPVVMVSATAILISGVNSRYISISDRMRSLAHEYRDAKSTERRAVIASQMTVFRRRVALVSWAVRTLYAATGCLVSIALLISATLWRQMLVWITLPLFLLAIFLIVVAIICELLELQASNRTISLETKDVGQNPVSPSRSGKEVASTEVENRLKESSRI
jgi:Protein of unknown function (DUF2721)